MRMAARAAVLVASVLTAGCATAAGGSPLSPVDPTTSALGSIPAPVTAGPPTSAAPGTPAALLVDQLQLADERSMDRYDRDLFEHWTDEDGDGCHTRCEVLRAERRDDLPGLARGWRSIYDGYTTDDPSELEVDHVVALAEAWRSGADTWDPARRRAFANDLDEPDALVAVTAATNRSKSDRDPASWQPSDRDAWCQFGTGWVRVKLKWGLAADPAEVDALRNVLAGC